MTTHQIFVENIKCDGCMNSIKTALLKNKGVTAVEIHKEEDKIDCFTINCLFVTHITHRTANK